MTDGRPKLLDRVRAEIRARHYSRRTEEAYVHWIRRYIVFHGKQHPSYLVAADVTAFLASLAIEKSVAASTQNQAFSALMLLYGDVLRHDLGVVEHAPRAKVPVRVPVVLSVDEVRRVLKQLSGATWLVASLLYGAGLRLQECLELRVKDVDFDRREITARRGKGQKDRCVMLPDALRDACDGVLKLSARFIRQTWPPGLAAWSCRVHWSGSSRRRRPNVGGSSSFRRAGSAEILSLALRLAITCTNPSSSGP